MSSPANASVLGWRNLHGFVRTGVTCHKGMLLSCSELGNQMFEQLGLSGLYYLTTDFQDPFYKISIFLLLECV